MGCLTSLVSPEVLFNFFQVMYMVRGLNEAYLDLILSFRTGQRNFLTQDLSKITTWCNWWDDSNLEKVLPRKKLHHAARATNATSLGTDSEDRPGAKYNTPFE